MALVESTKTPIQPWRVLATALVLIVLTQAKAALAGPELADLTVVDRDSGQPLPIWRHHGRLFVAGQQGARYSLRVTNQTDGRVLVVMSVDGVNVISGQTAGYDQTGYVFNPHQSYDVTGWRKSNTEVAGFSFAPLPQSYAARTGRPGDVGVIGIAVFKEQPVIEPLAAERRVWPTPHAAPRATPLAATAAPPLPAPAPPPMNTLNEVTVTGSRLTRRDFSQNDQGEKLGTAHGAREWSVVEDVPFVRATPHPQTILQIEYDSYDNLIASGVIPGGRRDDQRPRAFRSQPHGGGYVPDPPDDR